MPYLLGFPGGRRYYVDSLLMASVRCRQLGIEMNVDEARHTLHTKKGVYKFNQCTLELTDHVSDTMTVHDVEALDRIERVESECREKLAEVKREAESFYEFMDKSLDRINYVLSGLERRLDVMERRLDRLEM